MIKAISVVVGLAFILSGCASYSLVDGNGNKVSGSMMNGAASISSGLACAPTAPSPGQPPPGYTPPASSFVQQQVCDVDGKNCKMALMSLKAEAQPGCNTSVVNVRGTDITTMFAWIMGAGLGAFALAK